MRDAGLIFSSRSFQSSTTANDRRGGRTMLKRVLLAGAALLFAMLGASAFAQTSLTAGGMVSNSGNVLRNTDNPFLSPSVNVDALGWLGFTAAPPAFSGQIASWVFSGDTHNPYGGL